MDGRHKRALWTKATLPDSLAFSDDGATIYWADSGESELGGSFFSVGKLPDFSQEKLPGGRDENYLRTELTARHHDQTQVKLCS